MNNDLIIKIEIVFILIFSTILLVFYINKHFKLLKEKINKSRVRKWFVYYTFYYAGMNDNYGGNGHLEWTSYNRESIDIELVRQHIEESVIKEIGVKEWVNVIIENIVEIT